MLTVPSVLAPSLALIDSDPRPVAMIHEVAGTWIRRQVRGVVLDETLPASVRAQCCGADRIIHWSTGWLPDLASAHDIRVAAAILMHEARHAEGFAHSCPDQRRDRTFAEGGPWAVQATWLRHAGDDGYGRFDHRSRYRLPLTSRIPPSCSPRVASLLPPRDATGAA